MKTREDFVKRLREDPRYREALGRARTVAERKAISELVESFVGSAGAILGPIIEQSQNDPEFASQLARALLEKQGVLSKSQPVASGSIA